jgi:hypothetical protein
MIWIIGSRGIPARYGGFETLAQHLAHGFAVRGVECTVIGTRDAQARSSVPARLIQAVGLHGAETPVLTWWTRPRVQPGDSVLVLNPVNVWTALWLQRRGAKVVLHLDGMEHLRTKWGRAARALHRLARRTAVRSRLTLIADHPEIQRVMLGEFGRDTLYIAYGGCDEAEHDASHRWSADRAGDHYLVMARPEPENQVLEICQAFANTETDARLLVVGGPHRPNDYWRRIELTAASDPRIELLGPIWDRDRLCELMMTARAYIHGHTVGGTNPSLVDVLSHGTPVLAHDNVFNRKVLSTDGTYWVDEVELKERLALDLQRPGLGTVDRLPNWESVCTAYRGVLHPPGMPPHSAVVKRLDGLR